MTNIYSLLLHTLAVTVVAYLILLVKKLFDDKLSPRWQYGIWIIFLIRMILPVQTNGFSLLPLGLWIETIKSMIENTMTSAYVDVFTPITSHHILPIIIKSPQSITDYLFIAYRIGLIVFIVYYGISYLRLRRILKKGRQPSQDKILKIRQICEQYDLKMCKVIVIEDIKSAFVCGVLSPVLVISQDDLNEKIILHEMMHLKYKDPLQNIIWTCFRCLHWMNPFLWFIFDIIGNDMEALCDQRVLERLEGEERREYGKTLLLMANEKYARAVGTSSLSNGGKNIANRIKKIVRFKKYPKGMSLVSICIILVLGFPMLRHTGYAYDNNLYQPVDISQLHQSMALSRIQRPTTLAGALDTYAKGLMLENGIYLASASSLDKQCEIYEEMIHHVKDNWVAYHIEAGKSLEYIDMSRGYEIVKLDRTENGYEGYYLFEVSSFMNDDGIGWKLDEEGHVIHGSVLVPFIAYEEEGWVVEEKGTRTELHHITLDEAYYGIDEQYPYDKRYHVQGETGSFDIMIRVIYRVDNLIPSNNWFGGNSFDTAPKLNAQFSSAQYRIYGVYDISSNSTGKYPQDTLGFAMGPIESFDETLQRNSDLFDFDRPSSGGSNGHFDWSITKIDQIYENQVRSGSGTVLYDIGNDIIEFEEDYKIQIYWDGEVVEELFIKGEVYE